MMVFGGYHFSYVTTDFIKASIAVLVFDGCRFSYIFTGETTLQNNYIVFDGYHFSYIFTCLLYSGKFLSVFGGCYFSYVTTHGRGNMSVDARFWRVSFQLCLYQTTVTFSLITVFGGFHFSYAAIKQGKKSSYSKFVKEETFLKNSQWEKTFPNLVLTGITSFNR